MSQPPYQIVSSTVNVASVAGGVMPGECQRFPSTDTATAGPREKERFWIDHSHEAALWASNEGVWLALSGRRGPGRHQDRDPNHDHGPTQVLQGGGYFRRILKWKIFSALAFHIELISMSLNILTLYSSTGNPDQATDEHRDTA